MIAAPEVIEIAGRFGLITASDAEREFGFDCPPGQYLARHVSHDGRRRVKLSRSPHDTASLALAEAELVVDGLMLRDSGAVHVLLVVACMH